MCLHNKKLLQANMYSMAEIAKMNEQEGFDKTIGE